ncbi:MAG TPA: AraC family transcriptional regulator [Ruminiclostridium sp.]
MENKKFDIFDNTINNIRLSILDHGLLTGDSKWNYKDVCSPFNRLYFVLDGEGVVKNDNHSLQLTGGNVYLIPLQSTYSYACDKYIKKFYIHFLAEILPGHDIFEFLPRATSLPLDNMNEAKLFDRIGSRRMDDLFFCKGLFLEVVSMFMTSFTDKLCKQMETFYKYHSLYKYIDEYCHAGMTVEQIACHAGVSHTRLSSMFKNDTGIPLKKYLCQRIVQKAKEMLLLSELSVKEIAYKLGFTDEFYFSRFFKKYEGISPKLYRNKNQMNLNG